MEIIDRFVGVLQSLGVVRGDRLGLAASGGADSTALVHLAAGAAPRLDLRLHVLHVDHGLRPDAEEDARAVAVLAGGLGIPWSVLRAPVRRAPRESLEAAARRLRYFLLDRAAEELGCRWVATAHTMDDQAETVLLRAMRGAGTGGLGGISPVRGRFLRPLLGVRRAELRSLVAARGGWREDPTNADLRLERNWLRAMVLPELERRRIGVVRALARTADLARADAQALDELAAGRFERACRTVEGVLVLGDEALDGPPALAGRVVLRALQAAGVPPEVRSVQSVLGLAGRERGAVAVLAGGVGAWRVPGGVALVPRGLDAPPPERLPARGVHVSAAWGLRVRVGGEGPQAPGAWRCRLERSAGRALWLRARRPGDRVATAGGSRKVQDVLVDAGVPRFARDRVPVLATDDRAVAVVGLTTPPPPRGPAVVVEVEPLGETWWSRASRAVSS